MICTQSHESEVVGGGMDCAPVLVGAGLGRVEDGGAARLLAVVSENTKMPVEIRNSSSRIRRVICPLSNSYRESHFALLISDPVIARPLM